MQGIAPSPTITAQYYSALLRIVKGLEKLSEEYLIPVLEETQNEYDQTALTDDYKTDVNTAFRQMERELSNQAQALNEYANRVATVAVDKEGKFHRRKWVAEINRLAGVDIGDLLQDKNIESLFLKRIEANVELIRTIPEKYLDTVQAKVLQGLQKGSNFFSIRKDILKIGESTRYRAKLIARDQMSKLNGALNQFRQQDIGIDSYTWVTAGDERVRPDHKSKNNKVFQWNSPPPDTGHPGQDIQCRCVANPNFTGLLANLGV